MKSVVVLLFLSLSVVGQAATVVSQDVKNGCTVYRATSEEKPKIESETLLDDRQVYGYTLENMKIDFDKKIVTMDTVKRIVLGFDRPLVEGRIFVRASNPQFNFLVNQLNRVLFTFDKVCITNHNELIWATMTVPEKK